MPVVLQQYVVLTGTAADFAMIGLSHGWMVVNKLDEQGMLTPVTVPPT